MNSILRYLSLTILTFCFCLPNAQATHNRAGEITIQQIGNCVDRQIKATITTYSKASSTLADRDSLEICWGDGFCETVFRVNGNGTTLGNDTKKNIYEGTHSYLSSGTYKINMVDPNRNADIWNVNYPSSDQVPFYLETIYTFLSCQNDGPNSTPILFNPPINFACANQPFTYNPAAQDPDLDSLAYMLVTPLQGDNSIVPNYQFPNLTPSANLGSSIGLDAVTGTFTWNDPVQTGEYNIAFIIVSYRDGEAIDTTYRDMQIFVEDCEDNEPPIIETIDEICVVAGDVINFQVTGTDPDVDDLIKVTAAGAPLNLDFMPAEFIGNNNFQNQPNTKVFNWETQCEHISDQYYNVVFTVTDNLFDSTGLSTLKTVRIKIVGPPPEDLQAEPVGNTIELTWEAPYVCEDAMDDYFYTFSVWKRIGSNNFSIDECEPGLDGQGYTRVIADTRELVDGRYKYIDTDVERGRTYCYRVLALFAQYTDLDPPSTFNVVESLPSEEVCLQLNLDVPLLTKVSVDDTDINNGVIDVNWTKPVAEDLDTLQNPGPYVYDLLRADGINGTNFSSIVSFQSDTYWQANDLSYLDTNIDTESNGYNYKIDFYTNTDELLGASAPASSVFLSIASTDEINNLSWAANVPWDNFEYTVYRQNAMMLWDSIGHTTEPVYSDSSLVNGREYCYYIEAFGSYGVDEIPSPLINLSQEQCGIPLDTIPPCPPMLTIENLCTRDVSCIDAEFENDLTWTNPINTCEATDDVVSYNIYYSGTSGEEFALIASIDELADTFFFHTPDFGIAGCYAITALDTFANESRFSNIVCVDNCPRYELPNTFTPNGDGQNDLFVPYPYCFIESVVFEVRNKWGQLVWETTDPALLWDGKNRGGDDLPSGTYYYTCQVLEQRVSGTTLAPEPLEGWIELIR